MPRASGRLDSVAWVPRGLCREEAAYYIGVGTTKFDELVASRRMPRARKIDSRLVWDRVELDMAFSDLGHASENAIDAALQKGGRGG
jgi:predicted DNA-binding transcriptional regulator AlpA